jgi:hypothetical protein
MSTPLPSTISPPIMWAPLGVAMRVEINGASSTASYSRTL